MLCERFGGADCYFRAQYSAVNKGCAATEWDRTGCEEDQGSAFFIDGRFTNSEHCKRQLLKAARSLLWCSRPLCLCSGPAKSCPPHRLFAGPLSQNELIYKETAKPFLSRAHNKKRLQIRPRGSRMHQRAGLPSSRSQPRSMGLMFTSHLKRQSIAKCEVFKLPKSGDGWPKDAAGF